MIAVSSQHIASGGVSPLDREEHILLLPPPVQSIHTGIECVTRWPRGWITVILLCRYSHAERNPRIVSGWDIVQMEAGSTTRYVDISREIWSLECRSVRSQQGKLGDQI